MARNNLAVDFERIKKIKELPTFKVLQGKNKKIKAKSNTKASLIFSTLCIFAMLVIVSYRYNVISEKNLTLQRLEMAEVEAGALLTNAEIEYNRMIDISEVEAYAKQQLGMQEPEKSQMVYVGSDYNKLVTNNNSDNVFGNMLNSIKQKINEIF